MRNTTRRVGWRTRLGLATTTLVLTAHILTAQAQDLPEGKGKEIVQDVCSQCHKLTRITDSQHTPDEWKDLVNEMIDNGAVLTDEQIPIVVEYLAKNFPKAPSGATINVNEAKAQELMDSLKLTADEAGAIVEYREQNGGIKDWDDLSKVPGLDIKKLEPMKSRLVY